MDVMIGVLLAAATAVLWGTREILLRKAFEVTKPVHSLLATIAATFIISLIAAFFWESALWNRLTLADWALWTMVGVLHFPVAMALYYLGIDAVGASRTSVVSNVSAIEPLALPPPTTYTFLRTLRSNEYSPTRRRVASNETFDFTSCPASTAFKARSRL